MALYFCDSFDHYSTADIGKKYNSYGGVQITSAVSRTGTQCMSSTQAGHYIMKGFNMVVQPDPHTYYGTDTFKFSAAWKLSAMDNQPLVQFFIGNTLQYGLHVQYDGSIYVRRATAGTLMNQTPPGVITTNVWFYLEHLYDGGVYSIGIDGNTVLDSAYQDLTPTSPGWLTAVKIYPGGTSGNIGYLDDLVFNNGVPIRGDTKVVALFPTTDAFTEFSPVSVGRPNSTMISGYTPDYDTTYNYTATSGVMDYFRFQEMPTTISGSIDGVMLSAMVRRDDMAVKFLDLLAVVSGVVVRSSAGGQFLTNYNDTPYSMSTDYLYKSMAWHHVPQDTVSGYWYDEGEWTIADINNTYFGYRVYDGSETL